MEINEDTSCLELDNAANTPKRSRGDAGRCTKPSSKRNYTKKRGNIGKKKVVDTTTTTKPISLRSETYQESVCKGVQEEYTRLQNFFFKDFLFLKIICHGLAQKI